MNKADVNNLKALTQHAGWKVLCTELQYEIDDIERTIFRIDDGDFNVVKYNENDLLKRIRKVYKTMLEEPEILIEAFGETNEELEEIEI